MSIALATALLIGGGVGVLAACIAGMIFIKD